MSANPQIDDATRWLRRSYRAGALIDAAAAVAMAAPRLYGPTLRFDRRFRRRRPEFVYALRVGAPPMAGWTAPLLWADRRPLERRGVLPLTVVPVVATLMAADAHAVRAGYLSASGVWPVRTLQAGLVVLFGYSHLKAHAAATRAGYGRGFPDELSRILAGLRVTARLAARGAPLLVGGQSRSSSPRRPSPRSR